MKTLGTTMAVAALAGATAAGGAAAAQDLPELTEEQQFAVDLVKDFNICVDGIHNDPEYIASVEAYEQAYEVAAVEYETTYDEWLNGVDAEWHEQANAIVTEQFEDQLTEAQKEISAAEEAYWKAETAEEAEAAEQAYVEAMTAYEEIIEEATAVIEAEIGPHPDEPAFPEIDVAKPADPSDTCLAVSEQTATENGTTIDAVGDELQDIYEQYGYDTYQQLVTPAPAP